MTAIPGAHSASISELMNRTLSFVALQCSEMHLLWRITASSESTRMIPSILSTPSGTYGS